MQDSSWLTLVWFYDYDYNCEAHYVSYKLERHVLGFLPAYYITVPWNWQSKLVYKFTMVYSL